MGMLEGLMRYIPGLSKRSLEEDELRLFEQLKAEFEVNANDTAEANRARQKALEIVARYTSDPSQLTGGDVLEMDLLLMEMASKEELKARAPGLRAKYVELGGSSPGPELNDEIPDSEIPRLRAQVKSYLRFLHWTYVFGPIRERLRMRFIHRAMWVVVLTTIIWGVVLWMTRTQDKPFLGLLATVVYAGMIGGTVSATIRLGDIPTGGDPLSSIHTLRNTKSILYFSPMLGGIFALVLLLLFVGGVFEGVIFPKFVKLTMATTGAAAPNKWTFMNSLLPERSVDYALLFLWSFIAGFAEKFVPDALDRLVRRAKQDEAEPPAPGADEAAKKSAAEAAKKAVAEATTKAEEEAARKAEEEAAKKAEEEATRKAAAEAAAEEIDRQG